MPLTFAQPAGAADPREPYEPPAPDMTGPPEGGLIDAIWSVRTVLDRTNDAMIRAHACEAEGYRVSAAHIDALERAATAINTATAIYRARRAMP